MGSAEKRINPMKTLKIGIAGYDRMKARTLAIARGEHRPGKDEPKAAKFLTLVARQAVVTAAFVETGLADPLADGLRTALEVTGQFGSRPPRANQLHHAVAKLRRVCGTCSWHGGFRLPRRMSRSFPPAKVSVQGSKTRHQFRPSCRSPEKCFLQADPSPACLALERKTPPLTCSALALVKGHGPK